MLDLSNILSITKEQFVTLTPQEQNIVMDILKEMKKYGRSETLESLWYQDYEEIPVSIQEFISNPHYLGKSTRNGESIYPYWKKTYNTIFDASLGYEEIIFTGAIGVGKTKTADVCLAYLLYKLMCLKNPQEYYRFNEGERITIFFLNINLNLAQGVGYKALHEMLLKSDWFLERGNTTGRTNILYKPPKNIDITYGSKSDHALGQQVYCLHGNTKVVTTDGVFKISELCGKQFKVYSKEDNSDRIIESDYVTAWNTVNTNKYCEITLDNDISIKCTLNHKFCIEDGSFVCAEDISVGTKLYAIAHDTRVTNIEIINSDEYIPFYDVINVEPYHNFLIETDSGNGIVSHNCAMLDEINFAKTGMSNGNILEAQNGIMDAYRTIRGRMTSRFLKNGVQYGRMFLVSSKQSDQDFVDAYIRKRKSDGEDKKMLVIDEPQWVIKPPGTFSDKKFPLAIGNRSLQSKVMDPDSTEEEIEAMRQQGYEILMVPIDMIADFKMDINKYLMDLAGRSIPGTTSFFNYDMFSKCYINDYKNPFTTDILTIGIKDALNISDFFKLESIPTKVRMMPQFIHIDGSLSGDKTGISSVGVSGKKQTKQYMGANEIISEELYYKHIFSVDIKAPNGSEISLEKTRQFIYYLKAAGFNIRGISIDGFQSADTRQILLGQGFKVDLISLDRSPEGYLALRSAMNDERIGLIQIDLLEKELIQLQRDTKTGKIDHPADGCFSGDTLIRLANGETKQIIDLVGKTNLKTWGVTIDGRIIPVEIKKVFLTKYVNTIAKITLSNNKLIRCTTNHRFMLSNGSYKEAQYLTSDDELMCFDETVSIKSMEIIKFSDPMPVFDMEIPKTHNFLLDVGVFVHNSKDMSDSLAGALYNATLHKTDLLDGLDLLSAAVDVNEFEDLQASFMADMQQSLRNPNVYSASSGLDGLMNSVRDSDILGW